MFWRSTDKWRIKIILFIFETRFGKPLTSPIQRATRNYMKQLTRKLNNIVPPPMLSRYHPKQWVEAKGLRRPREIWVVLKNTQGARGVPFYWKYPVVPIANKPTRHGGLVGAHTHRKRCAMCCRSWESRGLPTKHIPRCLITGQAQGFFDVRCGVAPLAASFLGLMHVHSTQMA